LDLLWEIFPEKDSYNTGIKTRLNFHLDLEESNWSSSDMKLRSRKTMKIAKRSIIRGNTTETNEIRSWNNGKVKSPAKFQLLGEEVPIHKKQYWQEPGSVKDQRPALEESYNHIRHIKNHILQNKPNAYITTNKAQNV